MQLIIILLSILLLVSPVVADQKSEMQDGINRLQMEVDYLQSRIRDYQGAITLTLERIEFLNSRINLNKATLESLKKPEDKK
jgi:hypothetical protein